MITPAVKEKGNTNKKQDKRTLRLRAALLSLLLLLFFAGSLFYLFFASAKKRIGQTARIYQDGVLLETIDLSSVDAPYSFVIESADGGFNCLEVRPGSIGITDADCPDKLCVSMGFTDSSLLPVICLPHGLVIEITESEAGTDAISY